MLINLIPILSSDLILAVPKLLRLPAQIPIFHISHFCFSCHQTSFKITSFLTSFSYPALLYITCLLSLLSHPRFSISPTFCSISFHTARTSVVLSCPIPSILNPYFNPVFVRVTPFLQICFIFLFFAFHFSFSSLSFHTARS